MVRRSSYRRKRRVRRRSRRRRQRGGGPAAAGGAADTVRVQIGFTEETVGNYSHKMLEEVSTIPVNDDNTASLQMSQKQVPALRFVLDAWANRTKGALVPGDKPWRVFWSLSPEEKQAIYAVERLHFHDNQQQFTNRTMLANQFAWFGGESVQEIQLQRFQEMMPEYTADEKEPSKNMLELRRMMGIKEKR